jgi:hypothetical protein
MDLGVWLRSLGLEPYETACREQSRRLGPAEYDGRRLEGFTTSDEDQDIAGCIATAARQGAELSATKQAVT